MTSSENVGTTPLTLLYAHWHSFIGCVKLEEWPQSSRRGPRHRFVLAGNGSQVEDCLSNFESILRHMGDGQHLRYRDFVGRHHSVFEGHRKILTYLIEHAGDKSVSVISDAYLPRVIQRLRLEYGISSQPPDGSQSKSAHSNAHNTSEKCAQHQNSAVNAKKKDSGITTAMCC